MQSSVFCGCGHSGVPGFFYLCVYRHEHLEKGRKPWQLQDPALKRRGMNLLLFMWAGEVGNLQWLIQPGDAGGNDDLQQGWLPLPLKCSDSGWNWDQRDPAQDWFQICDSTGKCLSACGFLQVKFVSEGRKYNYAIFIYFFKNEAPSVTEHRISI